MSGNAAGRSMFELARSENNAFLMDLIRERVSAGGLSLADLGVSEDDYRQVLHDCFLATARRLFSSAKTKADFACFTGCDNYVSVTGLTMAELGTNAEEYERVRVASYSESAMFFYGLAKKWKLVDLFSPKRRRHERLRSLRIAEDRLAEVGLTLEGIGVDRRELGRLRSALGEGPA